MACALGYAGVSPRWGSSTTTAKAMSVRCTYLREYIVLISGGVRRIVKKAVIRINLVTAFLDKTID